MRRAGSPPGTYKFLEATAPLVPYLEAGAKVAVVGGVVVVIAAVVALAFFSDGVALAPASGLGAEANEALSESGAFDAQLVALEVQLGEEASSIAEAEHVVAHYGPLDPGPLAPDIASTFRSATYDAVTLDKPLTLYRVYGGSADELG